MISEDGGSLSQGQKQLLCITRVMLCLPPMLILDEATSSIDTRTEIKIQEAFARMMKGRTSFIVAHRLSTIREADIILVMRDGNIVEQGKHEELLEKNGFYAKIRLYPPSDKGARLSVSELKNRIEQRGIKSGFIDKNIEMALRARLYCTDILIAKAKMPVDGKSAEIIYEFDADKTSKPAMSEDGSVDFHKLDMIEKVQEGQLLATLVPIDYGTPGEDVYGNIIRPKKVKNKRLRHEKNIHLSEDGLKMYSDVSGNVTLVEDRVFVSDTYVIEGDVGPSTGDVDYDGAVEVKGNVITGYTVKAAGDITVEGAVEGATLISEGKIVLKRGMQGMPPVPFPHWDLC